jgi:hypothetical protein
LSLRVFLVTVILVAATGCLGRGNEVHLGGPLSCPRCGIEGVSMPVDTGAPFTHGFVLLTNGGDRSAKITKVKLLGLRGRLQVIQILAVELSRKGLVGLSRSFPPRGYSNGARPASGYIIQPGERVELLIGLRTTGRGVASYRAVSIDYMVDGKRYRTIDHDRLRVCSPLTTYLHNCPAP